MDLQKKEKMHDWVTKLNAGEGKFLEFNSEGNLKSLSDRERGVSKKGFGDHTPKERGIIKGDHPLSEKK